MRNKKALLFLTIACIGLLSSCKKSETENIEESSDNYKEIQLFNTEADNSLSEETTEPSQDVKNKIKPTIKDDSEPSKASYNSLLGPIVRYESGTAGASLKACIAVDKVMQAYKEYKDDITDDGIRKYHDSLTDDVKAQFDENLDILSQYYPSYFTKDGALIVQNAGLSGINYTEEEADDAFNIIYRALYSGEENIE